MTLLERIAKLFPKKPVQADPDLVTFLVELQQDKGPVQHLMRKNGLELRTNLIHVLHVPKPGAYPIAFNKGKGHLNLKKAYFPAAGAYIMGSLPEEAIPAGVDADGIMRETVYEDRLIVERIGSRASYEEAFKLISRFRNFEQDILRKAARLKEKKDTTPEEPDKKHATFNYTPKKPVWSKVLSAAALALLATAGTKMYVDYCVAEDRKQREYENSIIRRKDAEYDESLKRKQREEENKAAIELAKKANEEKQRLERIREQENKRLEDTYHKHNMEILNGIKSGIRNDLKTSIQKRGLEAEITDIVWEAYCSDPVFQKGGPNWSETRFTVEFIEPEYIMRAEFYTKREASTLTRITTKFITTKDGKKISFTEKGEIVDPESTEADKQYIKEFTQKNKIAEIRKEVIDTIIEKRFSHRADEYEGRD